jgi:hypothetical protein
VDERLQRLLVQYHDVIKVLQERPQRVGLGSDAETQKRLAPAQTKQLLTYLRLMDLRLGLLVNFGEALIKDGIKRVVNGLQD